MTPEQISASNARLEAYDNATDFTVADALEALEQHAPEDLRLALAEIERLHAIDKQRLNPV
jgi:hypothetical protein